MCLYGKKRAKELAFSGAAVRTFQERFYVGLAVCAHDQDVVETGGLLERGITKHIAVPSAKPTLYSTLENQTMCLDRPPRGLCYSHADRSAELVHGGKISDLQRRGRIYRIPMTGGTPEVIDTGFATSLQQRSWRLTGRQDTRH